VQSRERERNGTAAGNVNGIEGTTTGNANAINNTNLGR
jgi:hypothetical protein